MKQLCWYEKNKK